MPGKSWSTIAIAAALMCVSGCPSSKSSSSPVDAADGDDAATDTSAADGGSSDSTTKLSGTLGALGAIEPTVSSLVIANSGETLVYLSSGTITCAELMVSRWLGSAPAGAQVVEIVAKSNATTGTLTTGHVEVNFAQGGKSSAYEQGASTASVTYTSCPLNGACEGTVMATYENPTGNVMGTFHAEFCAGGQDY